MDSDGWPEVRLRDVCDKIGSGATPRGGKEVYVRDGTALIRSQNVYNEGFHKDGLAFIGDEHAAQLGHVAVEARDVLVNITGDSTARACLAPSELSPARVNQHVAIVRPRPDALDARYLRYFLISPAMQHHMLALASAGATRNALTKAMIADFRIPAPPLAEQRRIADTLGALDDKIELSRRMIRTLESIARAIFKSWFVDFDPVHKKMEGGEVGLVTMRWPVHSAYNVDHPRESARGADTRRDRPCKSLHTSAWTCTKRPSRWPCCEPGRSSATNA